MCQRHGKATFLLSLLVLLKPVYDDFRAGRKAAA